MKISVFKSIHILFPLTGLVAAMMLSLLVSYVSSGQLIKPDAFPLFFWQGWLIALQVTAYQYLVYFTIRYFNQRYRQQPDNWLRYVMEVCFVLFTGFFLTKAVSLVETESIFILNPTQPSKENTNQLQNISLTFLLVIYGFFTSFRIYRHLQQKEAEVIRWQKEIIQAQFEALKDQLNPHFLFNSLSVLTALVYQDANVAELFIDRLSKTYRYLLDHRDKHYVELENEWQFLANYQFLLSHRFGPKLQIEWQAPDTDKNLFLPPHTIMILLEHILSTSRMSVANPLTIQLRVEQQRLLISHTLQPRPGVSTEIDDRIEALQERYDILGKESRIRTYVKENRQFYTIPLFNTVYV